MSPQCESSTTLPELGWVFFGKLFFCCSGGSSYVRHVSLVREDVRKLRLVKFPIICYFRYFGGLARRFLLLDLSTFRGLGTCRRIYRNNSFWLKDIFGNPSNILPGHVCTMLYGMCYICKKEHLLGKLKRREKHQRKPWLTSIRLFSQQQQHQKLLYM